MTGSSRSSSSQKARQLAQKARAQGKIAAERLRPAILAEGAVHFSMYGTLCVLILAASIFFYLKGTDRYSILLAHRSGGEPTQLAASLNPNTGSEALLNWSKLAVGEIFTYNFNDIITRINASRRFFTDYGWDSFRLAFWETNLLSRTQAQRIFVSTLPSGLAVVLEEGEVKGRYTWTVQIGTVTSFYSGNTRVENNTVTLTIQRVPTQTSLAGYPFGIFKITQ